MRTYKLRPQYNNCNPFTPCWDNIEAIPADVQAKQHPQHVKIVVDQWYQCAKRSRSEAIRKFYTEHLIRMATQDRHLWDIYVHSVKVDKSMDSFPKVEGLEGKEIRAGSEQPNKMKVATNNGTSSSTPM